MNAGMYSSVKSDWETPPDFFAKVNAEFGLDLDVCATTENRKCARFFSKQMDGLRQPWDGRCWMNPPYGRQIGAWVKKAYEESLTGSLVVCLLPARTDTRWFHGWVYGKAEIRFLPGRIKFVGAEHGAPFPSMLAIYRGDNQR